MNSTIEKFITEPFLLGGMAKDSELVKEVEDILKGKGIEILEMEYDRAYNHNMRPTFTILTKDNKSLEGLAKDMRLKFDGTYDERSYWKSAMIKSEKYDIYLMIRGKPF